MTFLLLFYFINAFLWTPYACIDIGPSTYFFKWIYLNQQTPNIKSYENVIRNKLCCPLSERREMRASEQILSWVGIEPRSYCNVVDSTTITPLHIQNIRTYWKSRGQGDKRSELSQNLWLLLVKGFQYYMINSHFFKKFQEGAKA